MICRECRQERTLNEMSVMRDGKRLHTAICRYCIERADTDHNRIQRERKRKGLL